ncbi:toprim domain-containing protein [Chitinophaga arvensicola]|uniref:CHC2 zinc finger n=1 Tax=Chitinophaga arvensicola TaxID=29529 RepID=A0A1I0QKD3_9BACT|nr:toprim domain-containing protein [Chitinophaga arvensicola]SEW27446.1 CHC2 zinc finger [Chitinophaga arvensicola]
MLKLSCKEARQLDLVDYLASLGHHPQGISNQDYWYLSPLRTERTPSFKINRRLNSWYDHGIGKGGNLIDFGVLYFSCSVSDLLHRLALRATPDFSFHQPTVSADEKKEDKIVLLTTRQLNSSALLAYIQKRHIPLEVARHFCEEVDFLLYGKKYTVIGFRNNAGGYELRNEHFKGSSSSKDVTFINSHTEHVSVFEGFFSFLSFFAASDRAILPSNCLVLNSLSFFERSRPLMEQHQTVQLFLDRDTAGINHTQWALKWDSSRYVDHSDFFQGHKDLNDWLISHHQNPKETQRRSKRL